MASLCPPGRGQPLPAAIAYVPQAQAMAFAHTVQDIVLMGRTAHLGPFARPGPRDLAAARDAMRMMGILISPIPTTPGSVEASVN